MTVSSRQVRGERERGGWPSRGSLPGRSSGTGQFNCLAEAGGRQSLPTKSSGEAVRLVAAVGVSRSPVWLHSRSSAAIAVGKGGGSMTVCSSCLLQQWQRSCLVCSFQEHYHSVNNRFIAYLLALVLRGFASWIFGFTASFSACLVEPLLEPAIFLLCAKRFRSSGKFLSQRTKRFLPTPSQFCPFA